MTPRILVLTLHHAGLPPRGFPQRRLFISAVQLQRAARLLVGLGYRLRTVSDALSSPSGRDACFTFDDGYQDVVDVAFPALRALGAPATFYVVTGDVGQRGVAWAEERKTLPADLADWETLARLQEAGWEIGSHGHAHRRLARRPAAEQAEDVRLSFQLLSERLGRPPRSFAYPYGSHGPETVESVRAAGFAFAVTTRRGLVHPGDDPLQLRRVGLHGLAAWNPLPALRLLAVHAGLYPPRRAPLLAPSVAASSSSNSAR
jgi:peptidoglycan/xylan/chitin deacetylase (PgdA/CDA1 family)